MTLPLMSAGLMSRGAARLRAARGRCAAGRGHVCASPRSGHVAAGGGGGAMNAERDLSPLTPGVVRALTDKLYEKRKVAALEIEK